jgi:hypothetical protein
MRGLPAGVVEDVESWGPFCTRGCTSHCANLSGGGTRSSRRQSHLGRPNFRSLSPPQNKEKAARVNRDYKVPICESLIGGLRCQVAYFQRPACGLSKRQDTTVLLCAVRSSRSPCACASVVPKRRCLQPSKVCRCGVVHRRRGCSSGRANPVFVARGKFATAHSHGFSARQF